MHSYMSGVQPKKNIYIYIHIQQYSDLQRYMISICQLASRSSMHQPINSTIDNLTKGTQTRKNSENAQQREKQKLSDYPRLQQLIKSFN